jgi:hypothetical protein
VLACRDKEESVVLEAIRALFGSLPYPAPGLFAASPAQSEDARDGKRRARAWLLVSSEAKRPSTYIPGSQV